MADEELGAYGEDSEDSGVVDPLLGGMGGEEPLDDFGAAISEAFPENDWTPERLDAMKEAIRLCLEQDKAGEYGEEGMGMGGPNGKGDAGLALIFGAGPKKKS